jgi:hypothetical protein
MPTSLFSKRPHCQKSGTVRFFLASIRRRELRCNASVLASRGPVSHRQVPARDLSRLPAARRDHPRSCLLLFAAVGAGLVSVPRVGGHRRLLRAGASRDRSLGWAMQARSPEPVPASSRTAASCGDPPRRQPHRWR